MIIPSPFTCPRSVNRPQRYGFDDLLRVMAALRGEDGCPWDRAQTTTLRPCLLEEAWEVSAAIDEGDRITWRTSWAT